MEKETPGVTVPIDFLTELLDIRREHFKICEEFKIPIKDRSKEWVANSIIERLRTYVTAYIGKRSIMERENGAAFKKELTPIISDPLPLPENKV